MTEMTELYFYQDVYCQQLEVTALDVDKDEKFGFYLTCDKTICHPHGGGQKGDRANFVFIDKLGENQQELQIIDTRKDPITGNIKHILAKTHHFETENPKDCVGRGVLQLDWDFRYKQMRLHSVSHLLHIFLEKVLEKELIYPDVADIQEDYGLNVYNNLNINSQDIVKAVEMMNAFIAEDHLINTYPDPKINGYRYWSCANFIIPCGGTHPRTTIEIGQISANFSQKKGKSKITFKIENL
jgi:alanyl-tRNA synthetase